MKTLMPKVDTRDGLFHNGNPATGEQGTRVTDTWLNNLQDRVRDVQAEAQYVLQKAGLQLVENKQTQLYEAIVKIIDDNRKTASLTQQGIVQLTNDTGLESESLALTAKAGKKLAQQTAQLQLNVSQNYIQNSKKSSAVNSSSNDNVATSGAVKTAYDKGVEAKTAADNANNNANGRVSKSGDTLTGILRSVGIASKQFGMGAYSEQYNSGAPYMVEETGSKDRDTYHPFVKGRVRSNNHYGTAFSFGYTTKQGSGDGFGRGIINLIEDNGKTKLWAFEHDGEFRSAGDVKTSSGKSLETAVQPGDFQYQKKGNFEIRRYPDGTMIQSYFVDFTDVHGPNSGIGGTGQKQLTWAVSFVGKPLVWGNITSSLEDHHDIGVNILTKSTGTTLYWYNYEHSNPNQGACRLQFLAIGRWK
jgi:genome